MNFKGINCPKCGHHPYHAHAYGWEEYSKAECRFCHARFNVRESAPNNAYSGQETGAAKSDGESIPPSARITKETISKVLAKGEQE